MSDADENMRANSDALAQNPAGHTVPDRESRVSPSILRVCAVDPGITTGLAFRDPVAGIWTDEAKSFGEAVNEVLRFEPHVVVVERFATSGRMSSYGLETIELVGALRALELAWSYAQGNRAQPEVLYKIHVQYPQYRHSFQDIAKKHTAPSLHGRQSHAGRHEADALAHLLAYQWHTEGKRDRP